ncbi:MAG TPA: DUF4124 domain-containing protein [Pseudoxanthomonas sp.]|nr:DUF4124 domain-containing protein [Pseudoxanthomonas sp.]
MKLRYFLLALLLAAPSLHADEVVFYRCTDAAGALTLQNMPCPKGDKQEKKVMQGVATVPMGATSPKPTTSTIPNAPATISSDPAASTPVVPAAPVEPVTDDSGETVADQGKLPLPVLFQCVTYDKDSYITESDEPQSRCVPLQTVGLDGNPQTGAGEACEMKRDQCARVADGALCDAWKKRMGETEVAWRFARAGNEQKNKEEFERTQKIWRASTCDK